MAAIAIVQSGRVLGQKRGNWIGLPCIERNFEHTIRDVAQRAVNRLAAVHFPITEAGIRVRDIITEWDGQPASIVVYCFSNVCVIDHRECQGATFIDLNQPAQPDYDVTLLEYHDFFNSLRSKKIVDVGSSPVL